MSDRRIDEFPELSELNDTDIALISSGNNTYAVKVSTLKEVFGKSTITPVPDPSASGVAIAFIDTISQDAQGVITTTKKTVRIASSNPYQSGLMSATDKESFDKILTGFKSDMQYYLDLPYPIKAGTHALDNNLGNTADIIWARYDIPNAEANTRDKWLGYHPPAYAYVKNTRMELDDLKARATAAEAKAIEAFPTDTAEGETVRITDAVKAPVKALTVTMRPIQSGSGDPSAANPRTISGRTSVTVTHSHKNAANVPDNTYTNSGVVFTISGGAVHMTGTSTGTINRTIGTAQLKGGVTYTISGSRSSGIYDAEALRIDLRNIYGSVLASGDSYFGFTYTPTSDTTASINIRVGGGQTVDTTIYPQVEPGETATNFEPYEVDTLSVEWTDEAGAICGGTLNLVTGELLADWVLFETTWGEGTDVNVGDDVTNKTFTLPRIYSALTQDQSAAICNLCSWSDSLYRFTTPAFRLAVKPSGGSVTTIATVALLNDTADDQVVQIAYKAQKPFALYQLDPLAAPIITSQGGNEFESDADSVAVTYRADTTRFIARKIAEALNT